MTDLRKLADLIDSHAAISTRPGQLEDLERIATQIRTEHATDARMFIQWKGTNVCLDFDCRCGTHGHFDGDFAYYLGCPSCGAVYEMGTQVRATICNDLTLDDGEVKILDVYDG